MPIITDETFSEEPRLEDHRITVRHVYSVYADEQDISAVTAQFPSLTESEVREAVEYAQTHPEEIQQARDRLEDEKRRD